MRIYTAQERKLVIDLVRESIRSFEFSNKIYSTAESNFFRNH